MKTTSYLHYFFFVTILLLPLTSFNNYPPSKIKVAKQLNEWLFDSEKINVDDANLLIGNYLSSRYILRGTYDDNAAQPLRYFGFKAEDIIKLLSRIDTSSGSLDKVVFKFAISGKRRWQLVAYPMQNGNLLETIDPVTGKFSIYYNSENAITESNPGDARASRMNYSTKHPLRRIGNKLLLEGLSFNANQINEIINDNASGRVPDRLILGIGLETAGIGDLRWHIIAFGALGKQALDYGDPPTGNRINITPVNYKTSKRASVFDKADPCPPCN